MLKKILSFLIVLTLLLGTNTFIYASEISAYEITDEYVRIDYKIYEIENNTIQYNGKIYEVIDYALVSYEEDGTPILWVLPVEQNKVTDLEQIQQLNESVSNGNWLARDIPSHAVNLPYTASVPAGQWMETSPAFNMINGTYYYFTNLKLYDFPLLAEKEFQVIFSYCTSAGDWYSFTYNHTFHVLDSTFKIQNMTSMRYGRFVLTNLYGDPSPSYTYKISFSNV